MHRMEKRVAEIAVANGAGFLVVAVVARRALSRLGRHSTGALSCVVSIDMMPVGGEIEFHKAGRQAPDPSAAPRIVPDEAQRCSRTAHWSGTPGGQVLDQARAASVAPQHPD